MIMYWKSASNHMMNEGDFLASQSDVKQKISQWATNELNLAGQLLEDFVQHKVEEYNRSFIKVNLPFETEAYCEEYLQKFYQEYKEVIALFPYDRWAWIQKLESIQYGEFDIQNVRVESHIIDHKELPVVQ